MTKNQQEDALREFCQWRKVSICCDNEMGWIWNQTPLKYFNPLTDLNAIQALLDYLPENLQAGPGGFIHNLVNVVQREVAPRPIFRGAYWYVVNATAAQRVEAFLRTISKWVEAKD